MRKKKIDTIENLATLVQGEFLNMRSEMKDMRSEINRRFDQVDKRFDKIEKEIKELRRDINDLKLRMGEVAYHFEIKDIEKRLDRLELKAGIR